MAKSSKPSKSRNSAKGRFYAVEIDDEGKRKAWTGYPTALSVAQAVASLYEGVNARELARTWNAFNESGSVRFEIGMDD